jgi:hypothetical protein
LLLSNAQDVTADYFAERLREAGRAFVRVDTERLGSAGMTFTVGGGHEAVGCASFDGMSIDTSQVHAIYYRRPRPPTVNDDATTAGEREWISSELRRAWGGWFATTRARWVNHPLAISNASYKPEQLARAERMGLRVPETLITTKPEEARAFARAHNMLLVAKPISHGEIRDAAGQQERLIYTTALGDGDGAILDRVAMCPTLLQRRVQKNVDLRVTVVGDSVLPVALHSQEHPVSAVDCRRDNMRRMRYSVAVLPPELEQRLVAYVRSYDLVFAAIDLVRDVDGAHWFLEINPAGQWAWLEQKTGVPISEAIIRAFDAA